MSVLKRPSGRRVTGAVVGATLMVLGLAAPASAALAIASFTPTSGPALAAAADADGCVISITGTDFTNPAVNNVEFTQAGDTFATGPTLDAFDFVVASGTEIWATVPAGALTGPIAVTNTAGTKVASTSSFTVTAGGAGDPCGPTVASFTPTCGVVGTAVTVTGTNLLRNSGDATDNPVGANVRFAPYTANANATGVTPSFTQVSVNVSPASAADGPLRVTTWAGAGGTVDSTATFNVVTDPADCADGGPEHSRSITLRLKGALTAKGRVSVADDTTACISSVQVKIQRRQSGKWKTIKITTTDTVGKYAKKIRNRSGKYRAIAPKFTLENGDLCLKAKSNRVRYRR